MPDDAHAGTLAANASRAAATTSGKRARSWKRRMPAAPAAPAAATPRQLRQADAAEREHRHAQRRGRGERVEADRRALARRGEDRTEGDVVGAVLRLARHLFDGCASSGRSAACPRSAGAAPLWGRRPRAGGRRRRPAASATSARPLTSRRLAGSARRSCRSSSKAARSARSFSRSCTAGTPASPSAAAHAGSVTAPSPRRSLMASSGKGIVGRRSAAEAPQPELEVVGAPHQVDGAEARHHGARERRQAGVAHGVPGQLRPGAVPVPTATATAARKTPISKQ